MITNYGKKQLKNLKNNNLSKVAIVKFIDGLILKTETNSSLHKSLCLLRLEYATLSASSSIPRDKDLADYYLAKKKRVIDFLNLEKDRIESESEKIIDVIIENYQYQDEAYQKCGFGAKVMRLFRYQD